MSDQQSPPRIPLTISMEPRGTSPTIDARIINGYIEKLPDGDTVVVRRPGTTTLYNGAGSGIPQGCFFWRGNTYSIVNGHFYKNGVSIAAGLDGASVYTFTTCLGATPKLVFHNNAALYYYDGASVSAAVATPAAFLPGLATLDGTIYGLASPNFIYGSNINDPTTWNPLNVIAAQQEPDFGVAIAKQLQYVIVFKQWTTEVFYDAANAVGSPLSRADGYYLPFGCASAGTVQSFEDTLIWVATTKSGSLSVMMMENLKAETISTQPIEKLLQAVIGGISAATSWSARVAGHRFYAINLDPYTYVYDFTTKSWFVWSFRLAYIGSTVDQYFRPLLQDSLNGALFLLDPTNATDSGWVYAVDIYTPNWDGGTRNRKVLNRMEVIGDQYGMQVANIRWSDDDYQTWSNYRQVDLSQRRPFLDNLGTFYRRAFHINYTAQTLFRLRALELTNVMEGSA